MLRVRDPLGLIEKAPALKARVNFLEKVVVPICVMCIVGPILLITTVVIIEVIKHG